MTPTGSGPSRAGGPTPDAPGAAHPDAKRGGAAEAIGDILRRTLPEYRPSARGPNRTRRTQSLVAVAWERAAGPELATETRPATLQRGVLTVEVRSTALLSELQSFRRDELLARLIEAEAELSRAASRDPAKVPVAGATGRVTGLRFRPGVF
ncbi:MAG: DUF721 domain-containing protein [Planctomycetes bacterium]|nr:DUF721 domain-containing protein [Planctomycetota bacterium]